MTAGLGAGTVLETLLTSIERAAVHNRNVTVAPAAVLWPAEARYGEPGTGWSANVSPPSAPAV